MPDPMNAPSGDEPGGWRPREDLAYTEKQGVLRDYFERYRPRYVVETGLYAGNGSCFQFVGEATVYAIDPDIDNVRSAQVAGVLAAHGSSVEMLPVVLARLDGPALFWLDAHWVGDDDDDYGKQTPLLAELGAIIAWEHGPRSVVLIDDLRLMGSPGWPTIDQLRHKVWPVELWDVEERDDIMRLTPR